LATLLGCGPSSTLSSRKSAVAECLSKLPAEDIVDMELGAVAGLSGPPLGQPFGPTIDGR
jgi:hypothetical protein